MARLKSCWALGIKAGDLVLVSCQGRGRGWYMARVTEFIREIAEECFRGKVPTLDVTQIDRYEIIWVPADDLELIAG
ncbi:MAG: hypothetical protein V1704_00590 [Candidatus Vogelbacteria bacterium]